MQDYLAFCNAIQDEHTVLRVLSGSWPTQEGAGVGAMQHSARGNHIPFTYLVLNRRIEVREGGAHQGLALYRFMKTRVFKDN